LLVGERKPALIYSSGVRSLAEVLALHEIVLKVLINLHPVVKLSILFLHILFLRVKSFLPGQNLLSPFHSSQFLVPFEIIF
jgi:hypothetical protein